MEVTAAKLPRNGVTFPSCDVDVSTWHDTQAAVALGNVEGNSVLHVDDVVEDDGRVDQLLMNLTFFGLISHEAKWFI